MLKNYLILIGLLKITYIWSNKAKKCLDLPGWRITLSTGSEFAHRVPLWQYNDLMIGNIIIKNNTNVLLLSLLWEGIDAWR